MKPSARKCPITAIVTVYQRVQHALATLSKICECEPPPSEIIVHVDDNQVECEAAIRAAFPSVATIRSEDRLGPGGARNKLVAAARNEIVASFDDDSFPVDRDFFQRVQIIFDQFLDVSVVCAAVYHREEQVKEDKRSGEWVADFLGGGCVYRRSAFLATSGYVPLPLAYGMEEVDLAIRLHAQGKRILKTPWLRVFHDTDLRHHADSQVTALSIANLALLTYLRYPPSYCLTGLGQCLNRLLWLVRHGRTAGMLRGLAMIPRHLWKYSNFRELVDAQCLKSYFALRSSPRSAEFY